jgi:hypothetical protein
MMKLLKDQVLYLASPHSQNPVTRCVVVSDFVNEHESWGSSQKGGEMSVLVFNESYGHNVYVQANLLYHAKENATKRVELEKAMRDLRISDVAQALDTLRKI